MCLVINGFREMYLMGYIVSFLCTALIFNFIDNILMLDSLYFFFFLQICVFCYEKLTATEP